MNCNRNIIIGNDMKLFCGFCLFRCILCVWQWQLINIIYYNSNCSLSTHCSLEFSLWLVSWFEFHWKMMRCNQCKICIIFIFKICVKCEWNYESDCTFIQIKIMSWTFLLKIILLKMLENNFFDSRVRALDKINFIATWKIINS